MKLIILLLTAFMAFGAAAPSVAEAQPAPSGVRAQVVKKSGGNRNRVKTLLGKNKSHGHRMSKKWFTRFAQLILMRFPCKPESLVEHFDLDFRVGFLDFFYKHLCSFINRSRREEQRRIHTYNIYDEKPSRKRTVSPFQIKEIIRLLRYKEYENRWVNMKKFHRTRFPGLFRILMTSTSTVQSTGLSTRKERVS
jgi:hypothetical protein